MFCKVLMQKKQKPVRKAEKMAKAGNAVMSQHNYNIVTTKSQGNLQKFVATSRTMLQQRQSRLQDDSRKIVATFYNSVAT